MVPTRVRARAHVCVYECWHCIQKRSVYISTFFLLQRVELYQSALFFGLLCAVKVRKGLASFRVVDVSSACERACVRSAQCACVVVLVQAAMQGSLSISFLG